MAAWCVNLLTESLVLSGAGALLRLRYRGYTATFWLAHQGSIALPLMSSVQVDGVVLAWTVLIAIIVGLLFGLLLPASKSPQENLQEALKDSGPGASAGSQPRAPAHRAGRLA